ncbi:MAG: c-type cytochrome domain-containing protein [Bdellovibrionota bacterium]
MKTPKYLVVAVLVAMLVGCSFQENKLPEASLKSTDLNSFAALSANIFEPRCVQCHSGPSASGGVDISSYAAIMSVRGVVELRDPKGSKIFTEVESGDMPDNGLALSAVEVKAISDWILAGAPNGEFTPAEGEPPAPAPPIPAPPIPTQPPKPPVPTAPRYAEVQSRIFNTSCVSCHSGAKPKAGVNLSSFQTLMANPKAKLVVAGMADKSLVYSEILRGSMPPKGKIAAADIALLRDWINQGAHND